MTQQLKVQNFYSTVLTSDISSTWDTDFTVSVVPTYTAGFLVISPSNAWLREIVYFHNVVWNTISVRSENRWQGGTIARLHTAQEPVAMKDIAEIFNMFSDSLSQCFFVEKTGWLNIKVWWGTVFYNGNPVTVTDTTLALADNQTNYIKYSYPTNTISVDTVNSGNIKARVVTSAWVITSIQYYVAKESYIDFTVTITWALPSQVGQAWKALSTDWTNVSWQSFMKPTGNGNDKILGTNATWVITEYPKWTSSKVVAWDLSLIDAPWIISVTPYESTIIAWDLVWLTPDWLYECSTEIASSINITASSITAQHGSVKLSNWVHCFMYSVWVNVFARVWTLVNDTISYWTEISLYSGATANMSWQVISIWNNKVAFVMCDSTAITQTRHIIWTISGTTISVWSTYTFTYNPQWNQLTGIVWWVRVRDDVYAVLYVSWSYSAINMHTVSWTVVTNSTSPWSNSWSWYNSISITYVNDNLIWMNYSYYSSPNNRADVYMFSINPAWTNVLTTYSYQFITSALTTLAIARMSSTEIILTHIWWNNFWTHVLTIPWAWTTLVLRTLFDNWVNTYVIRLYDNIFWILNW